MKLLKAPERLKAISLHQPWADAVARGKKQWETRSFPTNYRGVLVIHAAWNFSGDLPEPVMMRVYGNNDWSTVYGDMQHGTVVAVVKVIDCLPSEMVADYLKRVQRQHHSQTRREAAALELELGNYSPGRWAWQLELITSLQGWGRVKGFQRFWYLPDDVSASIKSEYAKGGISL